MNFSQELQFILQSLVSNLPIILVSFGLLVMAFVRRAEARVPANYVMVGLALILLVRIFQILVGPNLPRFISFFLSGASLGIMMPLVNFLMNAVFAAGLLLIGAAVFMDRRKW